MKNLSIFLFLFMFINCVISDIISSNDTKDMVYCFQVRYKYHVEPGKSFGSLPLSLHKQYLNKACHRFFCKPHPRAGNGVFDCEHLNLYKNDIDYSLNENIEKIKLGIIL